MSIGKLCLIVEYCEGGCLLDLLRAKRLDTKEPLTISTMLEMASQIANGMAYLSSKKVRAICMNVTLLQSVL